MPPRNVFDETDFSEHLTRMKQNGINSIFLSPVFFTESPSSDSIFATSATLPDSQLYRAITLAEQNGFTVALKPLVNCLDDMPRYKINPANFETWFLSYKKFILHYFTIAETFHHTGFVIGTELDGVSDSRPFLHLCDSLRSNSTISIIYSGSYNHFITTTLWDHVDIMGINAYFNLDNSEPPSPAVLHESWNYWLNLINQYAEIHNKQVMITETGFLSRPDAAQNPGSFSGTPVSDLSVQKECYEALLSQAALFTSIKGIYFWQWELGDNGRIDCCDYTPRGKPAEDVVKKYWGE